MYVWWVNNICDGKYIMCSNFLYFWLWFLEFSFKMFGVKVKKNWVKSEVFNSCKWYCNKSKNKMV